MVGCFGPSKSELQIDTLGQLLSKKDAEIQQLRAEEESNKKTRAEQLAYSARLEAQLKEQEHENQELKASSQQQLQQAENRMTQQQELIKQLEATLAEEQEQRRQAEAKQLQTEGERLRLEEQLAKEKQQRDNQQRIMDKNVQQLQRRLHAEEQRSKRLQKQIANFTETMEAVSNVLTAVEREHKTVSSPMRGDKRVRSNAVDQLRQSLAAFKREQHDAQADDRSQR